MKNADTWAAQAALVVLVAVSLPSSYSHICESDGEFISEVEDFLFPKGDYWQHEEDKEILINEFLFQPNNTNCYPLYQSKLKTIILSGEKCNRMPTLNKFEITVENIVLKRSPLEHIPKDFFRGWERITELEIIENDKLLELSNEAFNGLKSLKKLTITNNFKLAKLNKNTFINLHNLRELLFRRNGVSKISEVSKALKVSTVPNLFHLDLSGNPINSIDRDDMTTLTQLQLEKLTLNDIEFNGTNHEIFCGIKVLKTLELGTPFSSISLTEIIKSVSTCKVMSTLRLHHVDLLKDNNKLFEIMRNSSLTSLYLNKARVNKFETSQTLNVAKLKHIEITESFFKEFPTVFFDSKIFPSIIKVILKKNQFNSIPNLIPESPVELLDLSGSELINLKRRHFYFVPKVRTLILSKTALQEIEKDAFIANKYLKLLVLSHNDFHDSAHTFNKYIFNGLRSLIALDMSHNKISFLPLHIFEYLEGVQILSLRSNNLKILNFKLFSPMKCLKKIDLTGNMVFHSDPSHLINNIITDIGIFSTMYNLKEELTRWFHLINAVDKELKTFINCSNIHIMTDKKPWVLSVGGNKRLENTCEIIIKKTNRNFQTENVTDTYQDTGDLSKDFKTSNFSNSTTIIEYNKYEFIYILFRPRYVFDTMTNSTSNVLRFLYVFTFYLIIFLLISLLIIKLVNATSKCKKRRREGLMLSQERFDYVGFENNGYNVPYEISKDPVLKNNHI